MRRPLPLLQFVRLSVLAAALTCATSIFAAEAPVTLSAEQLATARVVLTRATKAGAAASLDGASLLLAGRIAVPNSSLDLVLAPAAGRVESLLVSPGQKVRAGQPLARLYSAEFVSLQRELVIARTRAGSARMRAERDASLHDDGIIARNRLEESRAQLADAEATLSEQTQLLQLAGLTPAAVARIRIAADINPLLTLTARRAGSVLQQIAEPGEAVAAGQPLFRLANLDLLWAELQATKEQAARIRTGDKATINGCSSMGTVIAAAMQLDSQSQTTTVRVALPAGANCFTPNEYVQAQIATHPSGGSLIAVPSSSLVQRQGKNYVFVRTPAGLQPVPVVVERRTSTSAWITGNVQPDDQVASTGLAAIKGSWLGLGTAPAIAAGSR
jgi:membrane fusion protein, heavy metal efflux system